MQFKLAIGLKLNINSWQKGVHIKIIKKFRMKQTSLNVWGENFDLKFIP